MSEKRYAMIRLGVHLSLYIERWNHFEPFRTLATDVTFKNRVREDMLVRLLDAFVWRHSSDPHDSQTDLGFTYVQGMNVLAAPFLYIMPSEIEAFWSFAKFIEVHCPLYVQPTLEGVHRGLKVSLLRSVSASFNGRYSCSMFVWNGWIVNYTTIFDPRTFLQRFMPSLVGGCFSVLIDIWSNCL